jgi:K+-sensing histidine kinase KdpD
LTSILRDLREQKTVESRLRESEAALRALNSQLQDRAAVCAAVAHDLDSPLITIDEDARRVLEEYGPRLPEEARALLQELSGAAVRMRSLIDAFLSNSH